MMKYKIMYALGWVVVTLMAIGIGIGMVIAVASSTPMM